MRDHELALLLSSHFPLADPSWKPGDREPCDIICGGQPLGNRTEQRRASDGSMGQVRNKQHNHIVVFCFLFFHF